MTALYAEQTALCKEHAALTVGYIAAIGLQSHRVSVQDAHMTVLELPQVPAEERVNRNVRRLMKARGVTRTELAQLLGLKSPELVDQRLRGRTHWRLDQLEAAAKALSVPVDLLYAEYLKIEVMPSELLTLLGSRESCLAA